MASIDLTGLSQGDALNKAADFAGVDPSVLAGMLHTESGGDVNAVSPAGAIGAFQIMPSTQKTWEQREGRKFNPNDFNDSLTMAALTMKENLQATGGNISDALRMYNAGPDRSKWNNPETAAYAEKVLSGTGISASDLRGGQELTPDQVWTVSAHEINDLLRDQPGSSAYHTPHLGTAAKGLIDTAGIDAAAAALVTGQNPEQASLEARQAVSGNLPNALASDISTKAAQPRNASGDSAFQQIKDRAQLVELDEEKQRAVTIQQKLGAFMDGLPTAAILDHFSQDIRPDHYTPDPLYMQNYLANFDKIEEGYSDDEVDQLRETINDATYQQTLAAIKRQRFDQRLEMSNTTPLSRFAYTMSAGLLDPASLVVTAGVGKVASVAGVGAREAFMARSIATGLGRAGAEGAIGNVALTATTQAMGRHVSSNDYAAAAGFGFLLGAGSSLLHLKGDLAAAARLDVERQARHMTEAAAARNKELYDRALAIVGADPKPADIEAAATKLDTDGLVEQAERDLSLDLPDTEQLIPVRRPNGPKPEAPAPEPRPVTTLPKKLQGAKPRYSFGDRKFELVFGNDVDKAGYIIAQKNPSKRDADYLQFVMDALGTDEKGARDFGAAVRGAIKSQAEDAEPGTLNVEPVFNPKNDVVEINGSGESSASLEAQNRLRDEKAAGQARVLIDRDGSVRELTGVDAVDTFAREGQVIVQRGVGKDEWTVLSAGSEMGGNQIEGKINAARARLSESSVDDVEPPVAEYNLDMGEDFSASPTVLDLTGRLEQREQREHAELVGSVRNVHRAESIGKLSDASSELGRLESRVSNLESKGSDYVLGQVVDFHTLTRALRTLREVLSRATNATSDDVDKELANALHVLGQVRELPTKAILEDAERAVFGDSNVPRHTVFAEMESPSASVEGPVEDRVRETLLGGTKDAERLFPRPDIEADPFDLTSNARLNTPARLNEAIRRFGLDSQIADTSEKKLIAEILVRAEEYMAAHPVDETRLSPLLAKVGWEAASTRLLASKSDVARAFAALTLENPEGAAGRQSTAAIVKFMREGVYMGTFLRDYDNAYKLYAARMGRGHLREAYDPIALRDFDRKVYEELDRRFNGKSRTDDPLVKHGADLVDQRMNVMRKDQQYVGTVGSMRLPNVEYFEGYIPRRFIAGKVQAFTRAEREAAVAAWSDQFQRTAGWDKKFSNQFAVKYLDRVRTRALGGYDVPVGLHDPEVADMVRDSLRALDMPDDEINKIMGRFSRGGASHTKARIDADLTQQYPDGNGGTMKLMDMIDTNIVSLLRGQARRVSGEVALARNGVLGSQGAKMIREAIRASGGTAAELESFEQVVAEFLGTPFGGVQSLIADNARALTSALRMGGMGFTQLGDYGNAIGHIGVLRTFSAITSIPRLLGEVRAMRTGVDVNNHWLGSMEGAYGPNFGMDGYNMRSMYDVNDRYDLAGHEVIGIGSKAIRASSHLNHVMSGHRAIVAVQIRGMAEQIVQKALKFMREGGEDIALDDMGITREIRDRLAVDLDQIAIYDAGGHVIGFDIRKATDLRAAEAFMVAVHRGAAQIVQDTFVGETGKWAHSAFLKLLTQFRAFGLTSTQKQWRRQFYTRGTARSLGMLLGAMSFAIPIHIARVQLKSIGRKDRKKYLAQQLAPAAIGRSVMNYVAALGILPDVLDVAGGAVELTPYGSGPNTPKMLKSLAPQGGRYGGSQGLVSSLVPAVGTIDDTWNAIQSRKAKNIVKLLPGSNLPYLQFAINQLDNK